jgi:hypothetical protein
VGRCASARSRGQLLGTILAISRRRSASGPATRTLRCHRRRTGGPGRGGRGLLASETSTAAAACCSTPRRHDDLAAMAASNWSIILLRAAYSTTASRRWPGPIAAVEVEGPALGPPATVTGQMPEAEPRVLSMPRVGTPGSRHHPGVAIRSQVQRSRSTPTGSVGRGIGPPRRPTACSRKRPGRDRRQSRGDGAHRPTYTRSRHLNQWAAAVASARRSCATSATATGQA